MINKIKLPPKTAALTSELLILADGRIFVHNLTQPFAELLHEFNRDDKQISPRVARHSSHSTLP